jgi:uncharacterized protein
MGNSAERVFPSYEKVAELLTKSHAATSTSECHGLLCGLVCSGKKMAADPQQWAQSVMTEMEGQLAKEPGQLTVLADLFEVTQSKIVTMDFDFQILLPQDGVELTQRAKELGCWCQGFMVGLGLGGFQWEAKAQHDVQEALHCIADIANIDYTNINFSDSDEMAYLEVTEYVRLAVLSIYADIVGVASNGNILH